MKMYSRKEVVKLAKSWLGKNEADGSYKEIINIYNSQVKMPRGTKMKYEWAWCAATWSALAVKLGYQKIMPIEMSCYYLVEQAKKMGCWVEDDAYVPNAGDAVLYDWDDSGIGDNKGMPDHVGTVEYVSGGYITVIEGNYSNAVKRRTISLNGKYIRGFIIPKYDEEETVAPDLKPNKDIKTVAREVITGIWGVGDARKKALEKAGYNYAEVQKEVNKILNGNATQPKHEEQDQKQPIQRKVKASTYATKFNAGIKGYYRVKAKEGLYCRDGAGTNKKALCIVPYNTQVKCYGYYTPVNGVKWLYVQFVMDGVQYTGFCSSAYLKK